MSSNCSFASTRPTPPRSRAPNARRTPWPHEPRAVRTLGALARSFSDDEYRVKDGDMGFVHRGRLDEALDAAVFAAPIGHDPRRPRVPGFTVFTVLAAESARQLTLDEARPIIRERLAKQRTAAATAAWHAACAHRLASRSSNPRCAPRSPPALPQTPMEPGPASRQPGRERRVTQRFVLACAAACDVPRGRTCRRRNRARVSSRRPPPCWSGPAEAPRSITIAPRGPSLELVGRENDWCWVLIPHDQFGTRRAGWVRCALLLEPGVPASAIHAPPPAAAGGHRTRHPMLDDRVVPAAARSTPPWPATLRTGHVPRLCPANRLGLRQNVPFPTRARRRPRSAWTRAPPVPRSSTWIQPRMLRASVAAGYEASQNGSSGAVSDDRILQGAFTVATSFAILDPRVATIDFSGDFQTGRNNRSTPGADYHNGNTLTGYRFDASFLSGRSAPLRVFSDRVSNDASMVPLTSTIDPSQFTYSVRTSTGFNVGCRRAEPPAPPGVGVEGRQSDERNYLFGYSSFNDEQRADVRVTQNLGFGRYDVNYSYGRFVYDVPDANVRSDTGNDLLHRHGPLAADPSIVVRRRWPDVTVPLRPHRPLEQRVRFRRRPRRPLPLLAEALGLRPLRVLVEHVRSRALGCDPGAGPAHRGSRQPGRDRHEHLLPGRRRTRGIRRAAARPCPRSPDSRPTASPRGSRSRLAACEPSACWRAWSGTRSASRSPGSVDVSAGSAASNRLQTAPYREAGVQAGLSREWAQRFRVSADGGLRGVSRLPFYPVNLDSRSLTGAVDTLVPAWARVRLAVTWTNNLRDILYNDNRDQHAGYTMSISGRWYDVSVDVNRLSTRSLLLPSDVLGGRPDVALLLASNPEIYRNVLGSADHSRALTIGLRPWRGLQVNGRIVRQSQEYPTLYNLLQEGEQVWAVWQIRELQLEVGWERLESTSSFTLISGRRFYVRVRRDLTFF